MNGGVDGVVKGGVQVHVMALCSADLIHTAALAPLHAMVLQRGDCERVACVAGVARRAKGSRSNKPLFYRLRRAHAVHADSHEQAPAMQPDVAGN